MLLGAGGGGTGVVLEGRALGEKRREHQPRDSALVAGLRNGSHITCLEGQGPRAVLSPT